MAVKSECKGEAGQLRESTGRFDDYMKREASDPIAHQRASRAPRNTDEQGRNGWKATYGTDFNRGERTYEREANKMKKLFCAMAMALVFGVGGLTLTAGNAEAEDFIEQLKYHFETCSTDVIWECDSRIHLDVINPDGTLNGYYRPRGSRLPRGSNGTDQAAFQFLFNRYNYLRHRDGDYQGECYIECLRLERALRTAFPYDHHIPHEILIGFLNRDELRGASLGDRSFLSPRNLAVAERKWEQQKREEAERLQREAEERARAAQEEADRIAAEMEAERIRREEQARREADLRASVTAEEQRERDRLNFARFRADCNNQDGELSRTPEGSFICTGGTDMDVILVSYDPVNPEVYSTALQITPVAPLGSLAEIMDIVNHRQVTSDNRATIVTIVEEFNRVETQVLLNNEQISLNSSLIEAVADRIVDVDDRSRKNTAGIALGYALSTPGLLPDKRFAFGGGVGSFEGESAVAFTLTGRITDSIVANVGGGMAGSGDTGVNGFKGTISFQW